LCNGFEKRKNKGRIDVFGKWGAIKEKWVNYYRNGKEEPGISVKQIVSANDEWCAEAYMATDYSTLNSEEFEKNLKDYVLFNELFLKDE
jgi:type I restriction enzyme M protein